MRTQLLGKIDLDEEPLLKDLENSIGLHYSEPYVEFLCGRPWKSVMLWAPSGEVGDNVIAHYDTSQASAATEQCAGLPYIREIIETYFAVEHLSFARLAVMSDSVLVPHRDYVELTGDTAATPAHRLHVSLSTSADCLFSEGNVVYRMNAGEVWFLDASRPHSAGVLSDHRRVHLILDFADVDEATDLHRFGPTAPGIPESSTRHREPLTDAQRAAVLSLSSLINMDNLRDVFGIVIKTHYRRDGGRNYVWRAMEEIGERSGDEEIQAKIAELYEYYMIEREE